MKKYLGKSWRTTLLGLSGALLLIVGFVLVFLGKATLSEVTGFGGGLAVILTTIHSFIGKNFPFIISKNALLRP